MKPQTGIKKLANALFADAFTREVHKSIVQSLKRNHLSMFFQPIINHSKQCVFAYESLARPESNETFIRPDIWFQVAHERGDSVAADILAARSAMRQSSIAERRHEGQLLFVNVLSSSLSSPHFCTEVEMTLREGLCQADQLVFEITEHFYYDPVALAAGIRPLRDLGIRFALDDVGLGASNLGAIVELAPDFIKVDRTLVSGIAQSKSKQKIISQLVQYMDSIDSVIAEGIENEDDLSAIREVGVHLSQGFFWGQPLPFSLLMNQELPFVNITRKSNNAT